MTIKITMLFISKELLAGIILMMKHDFYFYPRAANSMVRISFSPHMRYHKNNIVLFCFLIV